VDSQKYIAIGDIHGCPYSMIALLEQLEEYKDRIYIFIGDYIDRGPDSRGVVDYLLQFRKNHACVFIRGNHEHMMLEALETGYDTLWLQNGGKETLDSYQGNLGRSEFYDDHIRFYQDCLIYHETDDFLFVHAGLDPNKTIREALADSDNYEEFLWSRDHLQTNYPVWEKTVVFGHTPRPDPIVRHRMIGIDTGCVFKNLPGYGFLTAVLLPEKKFIRQVCLDNPAIY
jgi:serine/threonine protein phosphatase 1